MLMCFLPLFFLDFWWNLNGPTRLYDQLAQQGTEMLYRPYDQLQGVSRRTSNLLPQPARFKVWISILKFDLSPKFGVIDERSTVVHQTLEDCDGMLRLWDGPLREPPICKDLNW